MELTATEHTYVTYTEHATSSLTTLLLAARAFHFSTSIYVNNGKLKQNGNKNYKQMSKSVLIPSKRFSVFCIKKFIILTREKKVFLKIKEKYFK